MHRTPSTTHPQPRQYQLKSRSKAKTLPFYLGTFFATLPSAARLQAQHVSTNMPS